MSEHTYTHTCVSIALFYIKYRHALWSRFFQSFVSIDKRNYFL